MEKIKQEMAGYWSRRVEQFSALRCREFGSEKHRQWQEELEKYLPAGRALDILDIGTGTGFLAFLLAERGHRVTGIDLTAEMIAEAAALMAMKATVDEVTERVIHPHPSYSEALGEACADVLGRSIHQPARKPQDR